LKKNKFGEKKVVLRNKVGDINTFVPHSETQMMPTHASVHGMLGLLSKEQNPLRSFVVRSSAKAICRVVLQ
jgi:hypothetical protein